MTPVKIPEWLDSVRSITTLEIITTYCLLVIGMVVLTIIKIIEVPVFLAFVSGFTGTVTSIITFYYVTKKRHDENGQPK